MNASLRRFLPFAVLMSIAVCNSPAASQAGSLKVGAAVVDVTPVQFPVLVNGGFTPRSVSKVKTRIQARAIVIQDDQQQIAIMVVDSCMLPQDLLDDVKQRVAQQTDLKPHHICISATHTHTAPAAARALGTDLDFDYVPFLREKLIQALIEANSKRQPAEMGWGSVMAPEYTALRRWVRRPDRIEVDPFDNPTVRANMHAARNLDNVTGESGPEDPELSMIAFRSPNGSPIAVLANFSMHYFGDADISADYFGLFCNGFQQQIAKQYPDSEFVAVMSHGCSGDIWRRDYRTWGGKDESTIQGFADGLRQKASDLLSTMEYQSDIQLAMEEVRLPLKYRVPDAQKLQWAERVLEEMETENPTQKFEVYAREQTYLHKLQEAEVVVQAIRLGNIGIVTTPCETYALTGLKFKKQSPFEHQMVIELANGALGYIPPPEQHVLGGYNTWPARSAGLEVTAEPKIVGMGLTLLERLSGKNRRPTAEETGSAAQKTLNQKPLAYFRMADMAGPVAVDVSGNGHHGVYEPGVCFYLDGSDRRQYTKVDVNRSAFFCGGRMHTRLDQLPQVFTLKMDVWNGLPVDARPTTGWFFSRDHSSSHTSNGIALGIGGTADGADGRLVLKLGQTDAVGGAIKLNRWQWYSIRLECEKNRVRVFLNENAEPEIDVARPASLTFPDDVFIGGRSDNDSNFEGRIDEVALIARGVDESVSSTLSPPHSNTSSKLFAGRPSTSHSLWAQPGDRQSHFVAGQLPVGHQSPAMPGRAGVPVSRATQSPFDRPPQEGGEEYSGSAEFLLCRDLNGESRVASQVQSEKSGGETAKQQSEKPASALEAIEAERGGRHWIDQETDPPRSTGQALEAFQIEDGFQIQLFASEPLVKDPVAITFDQRGDMYVVEYADYPVGQDGIGGLSRIVCLKDTNNDHHADQRIVFADGLDFAHSLMAYRDGMLVGAKTQLLHLKDTDGDGVADERTVLFDGFTPAHPQMQIGMPVWGLNNRIYCNYGPGEVTSKWDTKEKFKLPRKDFWLDPVSHEFGSTPGLGQYGNTVDRWGNRFFCTNRNPIKTDFLDRMIADRNSHHTLARSEYDVAPSGGDSKVFPLRAMKSNYLSHAGTHTSACGTTAWLGPVSSPIAKQKRLADSVFVCEPIGHLVTRTVVNSDQVPLGSERSEEHRDFLASTDAWFRPSSLQTGPDGALYLADMYRLWVEHPKFLPKEIADQIDWRAGDDRGRIYRVVAVDQQSSTSGGVPETAMDAVQLLTSENGWDRFLGQRLLVEQQPVKEREEVVAALRGLYRHAQPETRLHALATLDALSAMRSCELLRGLNNDHPRVREFAAKLAGKSVPTQVVLTALAAKATDSDARVRMRVALALRPNDRTTVINALAKLVVSDGSNEVFADALLTSCHGIESRVLSKAIKMLSASLIGVADGERIEPPVGNTPENLTVAETLNQCSPSLVRLGQAIGRSGSVEQIAVLLNVVTEEADSVSQASTVQPWQAALLDGLAAGLKRSSGKQLPRSLPALVEKTPSSLDGSVAQLSNWLQKNQRVLRDPNSSVDERVAAIRLLSWQSSAVAMKALQPLLGSTESAEVQREAVEVLLESGAESVVGEILNHWKQLRPTIRADVVQSALRRTASTSLLLAEMQAGRVGSSFLSIDQRARLLKHSNKPIRLMAEKIYPTAVSSNRMEVVRKYGSVIQQDGSAIDGVEVFKKSCSACHRVGSLGNVVGPDLTDVRNRSRLALLHEVLDPNSKVEPRFCACSIVTLDGKTLTGILVNETSDTIQLRTSGGRLEEVSRGEIEDFITSDKSLMPEGLETDITEQQMADLLTFLTQSP